MILLPNVDLIGIDCVDPVGALKSMQISKNKIKFGSAYLLTDFSREDFPDYLTDGIEFVRIPTVRSVDHTRHQYNDFCLNLIDYCKNEFTLMTHADGFVINPELWTDDFLRYDYIGAPWTDAQAKSWGLVNRVGNGGFSLRSRKMLQFSKMFNSCQGTNEDGFLTNWTINYARNYGISYAPVDLAFKFSQESFEEGLEFNPQGSFGFHGKGNMERYFEFKKTFTPSDIK